MRPAVAGARPAGPRYRALMAGGAPLDAQSWGSAELEERRGVLEGLARPDLLDPVSLGERWKTLSPQTWHAVVYKWLGDLLAVKLQGKVRFNRDFSGVLEQLGKRADLSGLLALARTQAAEGRTLAHPLNRSLQLQAWLIQYRHVFD